MKNLLIHSCIYYEPNEIDRDGNKTYLEAIELKKIRIVPVLATEKGSEGETKSDKLTLFYMPFVSFPQVIIQELALIEWQGKTYTVRSITPCYTNDGESVHHYEVSLV